MVTHRPCLSIRLLGPFHMQIAGENIRLESWKSKKALLLFKHLLAKCGEKIPSDVLGDLMWPDNDWESASNNLHTTVYFLRKTLKEASPPGYDASCSVRFANGLYWFGLGPDDFLDTIEFQKLRDESQRLEQTDISEAIRLGLDALGLYQGDFLSEELYVDWTVSLREHYREQFLEHTLHMAGLLREYQQDYEAIIRIARSALAIDPCREELHQAVISSLLELGRIPEATTQYKACAKMLGDEFGLDPSAGTHALLQRMRGPAKSEPMPAEPLGQQGTGVFVCNRATFDSILQLEQRRIERSELPMTLITITLADDNELEGQVHQVIQVLQRTMRKGDVATRWSDHVIALLLPASNHAGAIAVQQKLEQSLAEDGLSGWNIEHFVIASPTEKFILSSVLPLR